MNFDGLIGKRIVKVTGEKTEVKNKVELKSWFEDGKLYVGEYVKHKINQLDEPEVTLDKAFEKVAESYSMTKEEVWRRIEWFETHTEVLTHELPVVPAWFDEWYGEMMDIHEDEFLVLNILTGVRNYTDVDYYNSQEHQDFSKEQYIELKYNIEKYTQAVITGHYEVEKEQKYYVINKEKELILGWSQSAYMTPCIEGYEYMKHNGRENLFQLTEQEIKDYDERYLLFALKVEEVEQCYMTQL